MRKKVIALIKFALPFILTVLIPLASILYISYATVEQYRIRYLEDSQKNYESAFKRFISRIDALEKNVYQVALNDTTKEYTYNSILGHTHSAYENYQFQKLFSDYWMNEDAATVFFYDAINNTVVSPDLSLSNANDYFKYTYRIGNLTPEMHTKRLHDLIAASGYHSAIEINVNSVALEIVEYRLPLPIGFSASHGCQMVVAVRADKVFGDVLDVTAPDGAFYIYDKKGALIFSSCPEYLSVADRLSDSGWHFLETEGLDAMVLQDAAGKWTLKVITPQPAQNQVPAYLSALVLLSLLASTALTIYFTLKNFRQFQEILHIFTEKKPQTKEEGPVNYQLIKEYAVKIVSDNSRYQEEIGRYVSSRKYHLMDMLLRGTYENEERQLANMQEEGIHIPEGNIFVICVQCKDISLVRSAFEIEPEFFMTRIGEYVCVLPADGLEIRSLLARIEEANIVAAAGEPVSQLRQVSLSYSQAKTVLRYREITGNRVYLYTDVSNLEDKLYWEKNFDEIIRNLIISGNREQAKVFVKNIYLNNFSPNSPMLSFRAIETLKGKLKSILLSMADQYDIPVEDMLLQGDAANNVSGFFQTVYDVVDQLIVQLEERKTSPVLRSAEQIRSYIDEHFCDPMLSVKQISLYLDLHENYVSSLFKVQYGENLSAYIEHRRMEKACALLKSSNLHISEIASAVGYSSDVSFRRAFKKVTGVAPATYRDGIF